MTPARNGEDRLSPGPVQGPVEWLAPPDNAGRAGLAPPSGVLAAFGATVPAEPLAGGKNGAWRSGGIVLKPAEGETETLWRCGVLDTLGESPEFRIARPVRARDGGWLAEGWEAARFLPGHADERRVDDVIIAAAAFHRAVAALPRPSFLDTRKDPWAYGGRLAWQPERGEPGRTSQLSATLLAARRPVDLPAQLVHGDLLGNVLFADGRPPAIIDWSAYWRPPAWAAAVAVVDALCWHGVRAGVLGRWAHLPAWRQLLIRALIYRIGTDEAAGRCGEPNEAYRPVAELVLALPPASRGERL